MGSSRPVWTLTVRTTFSAAHALRHYKGKCERMHGHNYGVAMEVEGETLTPDTELLADFSVLKALLKEAVSGLDHSDLNSTPPFDVINPSSENLARYIWRQLAPRMPEGVRLCSVSVAEKPEQSATYRERTR